MEYDLIIASAAIFFGSITAIAVFAMITGVIRYWIKERYQGSRVIQDEAFLIALKEFKEKTDRRLSALESMIAAREQGNGAALAVSGAAKEPAAMESEAMESADKEPEAKDPAGGDSSSQRLKNMLS